jgi:hypothetical protein
VKGEIMTIEKIQKIDAACRQLDTAITLWFQESDPVAIHTLACASHQIIHDIIHHHGGHDPLFGSPYIKAGFKNIAKKHFHKHYHFFKHANRDPNKSIDFHESAPHPFILYSILGIEQLAFKKTPLQSAFMIFFALNNPSILTKAGSEFFFQEIPPDELTKFRSLTRKQFFVLHNLAARK